MAALHDPAEGRPRTKILLVDDRPENLLALEAILAALDQELVAAGSGEEALKRLLVEDFAVILLDVQMPGMDGFETAQRIKQRERTRDIPIIFLTAIDREPQHAFRGYAAGAVDYLSKPFDPWLLRAKVNVFVELFEKNQRLAQLAGERVQDRDLLADVVRRLTQVEGRLVDAAEGGEAARGQLEAAQREVQAMLARLLPVSSGVGAPVAG